MTAPFASRARDLAAQLGLHTHEECDPSRVCHNDQLERLSAALRAVDAAAYQRGVTAAYDEAKREFNTFDGSKSGDYRDGVWNAARDIARSISALLPERQGGGSGA